MTIEVIYIDHQQDIAVAILSEQDDHYSLTDMEPVGYDADQS